MAEVKLLILGAGWTASFLIPLLQAYNTTFAATTRDGRRVAGVETIKWTFTPTRLASDEEYGETEPNQFAKLPSAQYVLITFPLAGQGQAATIVHGYKQASHNRGEVRFIQLGSTGVWQIQQSSHWVDRKSPYDTNNQRAIAEDELKQLGGCILNLGGLWGGERDPRKWVDRVAKTKEEAKAKKSLHMIHGQDVARAIVGVMGNWPAASMQRYMLTDGFVYDWWGLFAAWGDGGQGEDGDVVREPTKHAQWVMELMQEEKLKALPRDMQVLGRCYDSREFWSTFGIVPLKAGLPK